MSPTSPLLVQSVVHDYNWCVETIHGALSETDEAHLQLSRHCVAWLLPLTDRAIEAADSEDLVVMLINYEHLTSTETGWSFIVYRSFDGILGYARLQANAARPIAYTIDAATVIDMLVNVSDMDEIDRIIALASLTPIADRLVSIRR